MVLTHESVDEILKCDHSNESYRAVPSCTLVFTSLFVNKPDRVLSVKRSNLQCRKSCGWLPDGRRLEREQALQMGTDTATGCGACPRGNQK